MLYTALQTAPSNRFFPRRNMTAKKLEKGRSNPLSACLIRQNIHSENLILFWCSTCLKPTTSSSECSCYRASIDGLVPEQIQKRRWWSWWILFRRRHVALGHPAIHARQQWRGNIASILLTSDSEIKKDQVLKALQPICNIPENSGISITSSPNNPIHTSKTFRKTHWCDGRENNIRNDYVT